MRRYSGQNPGISSKEGSTLRLAAFLAALAALTLTGCRNAPVVVLEAEPVRIEVPVIVQCVKEVPVKPGWSFEVNATQASPLTIQVDALLDEREQRAEYESILEAVIQGCK